MAGFEEIPVSFGFQSNPGRYGQDGTNRIINAYAEQVGDEGKKQVQLYVTEGLRPRVTLPTAPVTMVFPVNEYLFALAGTTVYKIEDDWSYTTVGSITSGGVAYAARSRREIDPQVVFSVAGDVWVIEGDANFATTSLYVISDVDLKAVSSLTSIDGYFIYGMEDASAGKFFVSALDNPNSISAIDFATAESDADRLVRVFRRKGELWLLGEDTTEVWANNGDADFTFIRLPGVSIDRGCLAPASVAMLEEMVVWVADDNTVRAAPGYTAQRISHHAVERSIAAEPNKRDISALVINSAGHALYVVSGSTFTWVYDHTTKLWHERKSYRKERWRAGVSCRWKHKNNITVVGDYQTGAIYEVDPSFLMDGADPLVMQLTGPILSDHPSSFQFFELAVDVTTGVGTETGSESDIDPGAMLRYSDDGGKTWSNELTGKLGKIGEFATDLKFTRLGQCSSKGRVFEFTISAAVARAFMSATAKIRRLSR